MNIRGQLLQFFQKICSYTFGSFEKEEFKKFLKNGAYFFPNHWGLLDTSSQGTDH
jgi:hypothetical protein